MEVKIGVQNAARELSVETTSSPEHLLEELSKAIKDNSLFTLTDDKGSTVAVPADKIAYLNFTADTGRAVGFGQVSAI